MPTVALHCLLTGRKESLAKARGFMEMLLKLDGRETTRKRDSGMSSANLLFGAALAYDWLYNDLEPGLREKFRRRLIYQARAQHHGGHLNRNKALGYWQNDPANNHRRHPHDALVHVRALERQAVLAGQVVVPVRPGRQGGLKP